MIQICDKRYCLNNYYPSAAHFVSVIYKGLRTSGKTNLVSQQKMLYEIDFPVCFGFWGQIRFHGSNAYLQLWWNVVLTGKILLDTSLRIKRKTLLLSKPVFFNLVPSTYIQLTFGCGRAVIPQGGSRYRYHPWRVQYQIPHGNLLFTCTEIRNIHCTFEKYILFPIRFEIDTTWFIHIITSNW